jgi:hypothetical protein
MFGAILCIDRILKNLNSFSPDTVLVCIKIGLHLKSNAVIQIININNGDIIIIKINAKILSIKKGYLFDLLKTIVSIVLT